MMRNLILLIFWITCPMAICAQNTVLGVLIQEDNTPIALANIRLLTIDNNILVSYTTTNMNGGYEMQVKDFGKYWLVASCIGYKEEKTLIEVPTAKTVVNVKLKKDIQELSEIVINTKSLEVYQKNDTISFNLKKLTNGTEISLKDILKKLPGISLEKGKIYAQGKVIDKILINGDEFALNQRTLSETLAAKMIGGIDLLKNYKQNSILTDFNTQQEQALNLKIKEEYLGVFKGEIGLGNGLINKYSGRGFGYNLGDKFKTSIIIDVNNTGENPITITEFIELKGGLSSLFGNRPSPLNNEISLNNGIIPMSIINASRVKNKFGSCNINYRYSPTTKISGSILMFDTGFNSWDQSSTGYNLNDKTITVFDESKKQKAIFMEQGNFSIEYRKSTNENIVYKASQSYSTANNNVEINSSNFLWQHFYQESRGRDQFFDQDLSLLKRYSNSFILYSSIHHTFENKANQDNWIAKDQAMNQTYGFKRNYVSGELQIAYKPLKIQYEFNLGFRQNSTIHNTNLLGSNYVVANTYSGTVNQLIYNNTNMYFNISLNKKNDFFQFSVSLTPSYFNVGSHKDDFLLYNLKADFYFTKNNHLDFSFQNDYILIDAQKTFTGLFANSYRDFSTSNLQNNIFTAVKKCNLSYYFSKVLTGTNIYANLSYSELKNAITTNTEISNNAQYNITTYLISPLQKKYTMDFAIEQRLLNLPLRLKLQGNFDANNLIAYSQGNSNLLSTKNYNGTLSFQTTLKNPFNINGGVYLEKIKNSSTLWINKNELISCKPYLTSEYEHKEFTLNITATYNYLDNGSSKIKYLDLSPQIKYRMENTLWEFSLKGNNLLNLNTIALVNVDYGNNYFQTSKYSRLPGFLLVKVKYFF